MRTRQQFDADLVALEQKFLTMGGLAGRMLDQAMDALIMGNIALASKVVSQDDTVDQYNIDIDAECMRLVIQQQPLAHDLRFIGMIFKAVTEVERIADHAVDIAKLAIHIRTVRRYEPLVDVGKLARLVRAMYTSALQAFAEHNIELVQIVIDADNAVDDLFHEQRSDLLRLMHDDSDRIILASDLIFAVQFLERIGDRRVNIVERLHQIEVGRRPF